MGDGTRRDVEIFRRERLMESCEDDAALAAEVVEDFLASTPLILSRLRAAVAGMNSIDARLEAHSLKGSAQTLGAERLAEESRRMETAAREGNLARAPERASAIDREFARVRAALEDFRLPAA